SPDTCTSSLHDALPILPNTLCGDGDPADVLVVLPLPLVPGSVVRCRPVGVLKMSDEAGGDEKILAVPVAKVFAGYAHVENINQRSEEHTSELQSRENLV